MSTNPPLSAARAGVPARQAGEQARPMGIPTLVPPAPPARPSPPLPRPEEPLNVTNELQSICGHGGKSNYMVRLGGRGRRKVRASGMPAPRRRSALRSARGLQPPPPPAPPPAPTALRTARLRRPLRAGTWTAPAARRREVAGCRGLTPPHAAPPAGASPPRPRRRPARRLRGVRRRDRQLRSTRRERRWGGLRPAKGFPPLLVPLSGLLPELLSRGWQREAAPSRRRCRRARPAGAGPGARRPGGRTAPVGGKPGPRQPGRAAPAEAAG